MKRINFILCFCFIAIIGTAQKPPITHAVYDSWKNIRNLNAPANGNVILYNINSQHGDGTLVIYNVKTENSLSIPRATEAVLSDNARKVVAIIKPLYEQNRQARIKKVKKDDMPKDTLAIIDVATGHIDKYPGYVSYKLPYKLDNYIAFQAVPKKEAAQEKGAGKEADPKAGTASKEKKEAPNKSGNTAEKDNLYILNMYTNTIDTLKHIESYKFKQDGSLLAYVLKPEEPKKKTPAKKEAATDTTAQSGEKTNLPAQDADSAKIAAPLRQGGLYTYNPVTKEKKEILSGPKGSQFTLPAFSPNNLMAFYANTDTSKTGKKNISIYLYNPKTEELSIAADSNTLGLKEGWIVNKRGRITFSENGQRLFFGTSPKPLEKDTSLVDFEQPQLDIWSWHEDYIQPEQLLVRDYDLQQTYTAYINIDDLNRKTNHRIIQLGDMDVPSVAVPDKGNARYALVSNNKKYRVELQWNIQAPSDIYLVDIQTGDRKLLYENVVYHMVASPKGNYYTIYDSPKKNWFLYNVASSTLTPLTEGLPYPFYNVEYDQPSLPSPAGNAIWKEDESAILISDKFDIWQFDPTGAIAPFRLTEGYGRDNQTMLTIIPNIIDISAKENIADIYRSRRSVFVQPDNPLYFSSLNKINKEQGLFFKDITKKNSKLTKLKEGPYTYASLTFTKPGKKGEKPVYTYVKGNFSNPMDLWITRDNFKTEKQVSDINPQQREYNWGTAELVSWTTEDGIKADGILFKPEDFDSTKKYPVILYFYEKNSETLYNYRNPAPSRSTINIPFFVSNGYIVFVPDIYYFDGHPGKSAMRSIMPGVAMLEQYPWIDGDNMAIQGQSWGGYQVAYMITQTSKFKAAGAGAPVANMTSAYGGIRWGSGRTRQFQYEQTQSRIGTDLWSGFDLYYENSPQFFLPNVTTPVLIMHNDKDGAVPWYQGIEFFTGLRRLGKVAWLLQYNDEEHNLRERRNAKDLSIRLEQFFNHYLKGAPMPEWMKYGRPAVKKGFDLGYKLVPEEEE